MEKSFYRCTASNAQRESARQGQRMRSGLLPSLATAGPPLRINLVPARLHATLLLALLLPFKPGLTQLPIASATTPLLTRKD